MAGLKVLAWNVQQGGGNRIPRIVAAIESEVPDVVVISEPRAGGRNCIASRLEDAGYVEQQGGQDPSGSEYAALLIASRAPFEQGDVTFTSETDGHRFQHVTVDGVDLVGLYIPGVGAPDKRKQKFWDFLVGEAAPQLIGRKAMLIGDLNTGLHYRDEPGATLHCSEQFQALLDAGWVDAWVDRNPKARPPGTWISNGDNPFRIDHALVSPVVARARSVAYPTEINGESVFGENRLSDHLPVVVELS